MRQAQISGFKKRFLRITSRPQFFGTAVCVTACFLISGYQTKFSPWRLGEVLHFGKIPHSISPQDPRHDVILIQKRIEGSQGFPNIIYESGKSMRLVDWASNAALPLVAFCAIAALGAATRRR